MLTPRNFVCVENGIVSSFIFIRHSLIVKVHCLVRKSMATGLFVSMRSLFELNQSVTFGISLFIVIAIDFGSKF